MCFSSSACILWFALCCVVSSETSGNMGWRLTPFLVVAPNVKDQSSYSRPIDRYVPRIVHSSTLDPAGHSWDTAGQEVVCLPVVITIETRPPSWNTETSYSEAGLYWATVTLSTVECMTRPFGNAWLGYEHRLSPIIGWLIKLCATLWRNHNIR